jgi:hypothetical protein
MIRKAENLVSKGEGHLFKAYLGNEWSKIHPNIQKRFSQDPSYNRPISYSGAMSIVYCSIFGKILAYITKRTGALQPYKGIDVPVDIIVSAQSGIEGVFKQRTYYFRNKKPFHFNSHMVMRDGKLLEFVGGGFGMNIDIEVRDGDLHFFDGGYFLNVGRMRIPLPDLFSPGKTHLIHKNIDDKSFEITININHRLFGKMFHQKGVFRHA